MSDFRYPRTFHIDGSGVPSGSARARIDWASLSSRHVVIEEKMDGSETSFEFDADLEPVLRYRGTPLDLSSRGGSERQFDLLKDWFAFHADILFDRLDTRYRVYGEWLYAAHRIYYDALPCLFMEFDVLDLASGDFLDTPRRGELLEGLSPIHSVRVVAEGMGSSIPHPSRLPVRSAFRSDIWMQIAAGMAIRAGLQSDLTLRRFDAGFDAEGFYGKVEEGGIVTCRFKWVRPDFVAAIVSSGTHWKDMPLVPNTTSISAPSIACP